MPDFDQAWAVVLRDSGELDGDQLDTVNVLRIYRSEEAARSEVERRRAEDTNQDHLYYCEETEVERAD